MAMSDHLSEELSEEEYASHVHAKHEEYSVQMLSNEGRRAAESTPVHYERPCPFCATPFENCDDLENHIIYHLECIALLTLPQKAAADDDFDSQSAGQIDDSRIADSQLDEWNDTDTVQFVVPVTETTDKADVDQALRADSLDLHQSQYHDALNSAQMILTWRASVDNNLSAVYSGSKQFI